MSETVEQYCARNGITVERYYELKKEAMNEATFDKPTYEYEPSPNRKQRRKEAALARKATHVR